MAWEVTSPWEGEPVTTVSELRWGCRVSAQDGLMLGWARGMCGWASNIQGILGHAGRRFRSTQSAPSVPELLGQRLIEDVLGHGFRLGRMELRCLIEKEVTLRWPPVRREGRG